MHGKLCVKYVIAFSEELTKKINEVRDFDIVYIHFSTAFDKMLDDRLVI